MLSKDAVIVMVGTPLYTGVFPLRRSLIAKRGNEDGFDAGDCAVRLDYTEFAAFCLLIGSSSRAW